MSTKLDSLTQRVRGKPNEKFTSLAHLLDEGFLEGCFRELKRDRASGIDGVSVKEYEENLKQNVEELVERLL